MVTQSHITPFCRAYLIKRINSFATLPELEAWWVGGIGKTVKTDPAVIAAKDERKKVLSA